MLTRKSLQLFFCWRGRADFILLAGKSVPDLFIYIFFFLFRVGSYKNFTCSWPPERRIGTSSFFFFSTDVAVVAPMSSSTEHFSKAETWRKVLNRSFSGTVKLIF